jgi:hypothetical protein
LEENEAHALEIASLKKHIADKVPAEIMIPAKQKAAQLKHQKWAKKHTKG